MAQLFLIVISIMNVVHACATFIIGLYWKMISRQSLARSEPRAHIQHGISTGKLTPLEWWFIENLLSLGVSVTALLGSLPENASYVHRLSEHYIYGLWKRCWVCPRNLHGILLLKNKSCLSWSSVNCYLVKIDSVHWNPTSAGDMKKGNKF